MSAGSLTNKMFPFQGIKNYSQVMVHDSDGSDEGAGDEDDDGDDDDDDDDDGDDPGRF